MAHQFSIRRIYIPLLEYRDCLLFIKSKKKNLHVFGDIIEVLWTYVTNKWAIISRITIILKVDVPSFRIVLHFVLLQRQVPLMEAILRPQKIKLLSGMLSSDWLLSRPHGVRGLQPPDHELEIMVIIFVFSNSWGVFT